MDLSGKFIRKVNLAFLSLLLGPMATLADEGLYGPWQLQLPFSASDMIGSVVQARPLIKFHLHIFATKPEADAYRVVPGNADKVFLPSGGAVWQAIASRDEIHQVCGDPNQFLKPGFFEICDTYKASCKDVPCHVTTDLLEGGATGFFISSAGHFLTNYHVARECIERLGRTTGSSLEEICPDLEVSVPVFVGGSSAPIYQRVSPVRIIRNVSVDQYKQGYDFALLKVDVPAPKSAKMSAVEPTHAVPVWMFGFPARTRRADDALRALNYHDANGSLRISRGSITVTASESSFQSTVDGLHGNSCRIASSLTPLVASN